MRKFFTAAFLLFLLASFHPAHAAQSSSAPRIGRITEVQGSVTVKHTDAKGSSDLRRGDPLFQDDVVATAKDSRVRMVFDDGTDLTMAENGTLTLDEFVYDPKRHDGRARFSILGAAFTYVGGLIGKGKEPDVSIDIDFGSIGIRGTRLYRAMHKGECWIYVEKGRVDVSNAGGKVSLGPGDGTIMTARDKAPAAPHPWPRDEIKWIKSTVAGKPVFPSTW